MNGAFEVSAAALRAEQKALEIYANNVANVNTPGFKRTEASFSEVLAASADQGVDAAPPGVAAALAASGGVQVLPQEMLFTQGNLQATSNPLDIAIQGQGMIELVGEGGDPVYWRGGRLQVNDDGLLATTDGLPLRAGIIVPNDAEALTIAGDGTVSVKTSTDESVEIGQIGLVRADRPDAFERLDKGLFKSAPDAHLIDAKPGEDGAGTLAQGNVEQSNVDLSEEMVRMLVVQRAFAADAQVIQAADQLAALTNNLKK